MREKVAKGAQMKKFTLIALCAGLALLAGWAVKASDLSQKPPRGVENADSRASLHNIVITSSDGKTHVFKVELAVSEEEVRLGLMGRTALAPDAGMLFAFENARERSFWMRNTLIPLDILFLDEDGQIVKIYEKTRPMDETPLPSGAPILGALEIGGGRAAALGIRIGDTVHHNLFGNALDGASQTP